MQYGLSIAFSAPSEYSALARAAEDAGFSWVTLADHLLYPQQLSVPYPYTPDGKPRFADSDAFPEPWTAITAMAQHTRHIRFYTNIYVLPARNAFHVAKALSTTAVFTEGRIALGVGMGWMPEEFAASGQPFGRRGRHADEMLAVMKKLWTGEWAEHHGEFYDFAPVRMLPAPPQPIPVFIGGISEPAMKRAVRHDGWISDLHTMAELKELLDRMWSLRAEHGAGRDGFQVLCFNPLDAVTPESHARLESWGVTTITTMPWAREALQGPVSLARKLQSIQEFSAIFIR
ncbi:MAG TPA: TIGR03619 family F420-dependent LLM class oxidoreductase [Rhodocyclaceae bacterium]|nr:TIGR03619 family F420-dependent LLM class oxidoreductase [Rhodocyclaceae bacterium]